jgi:hypothetical protein
MESIEAQAYAKHMNLKLAANELGMNWRTLYVRLKNQGVKIVGDKLRYGTDRDKLGAYGEKLFLDLVPSAKNENSNQFQAKYDFSVYGYKVDIKAGRPRQLNKKFPQLAWSFSFKKQTLICDFIICFCLNEDKSINKILLVPKEFFAGLQTVSVSMLGYSKWHDYSIEPHELFDFFKDLPSLES